MKKSVTKVLILCLSAALTATAAVGAVSLGTASATEASISFSDLAEVYSLGTKLQIPSDASVSYGGETRAAENCYLVTPGGSALSGKSFTLNDAGEYTLVLEATFGGKKVSAEKSFKALKEYYTLSNSASSVYYGELNNSYKKKGMNNGVVAELTEGATLTISEPINVYADKKVDLLTFNLMRMDASINYLSIKVVDCYDPEIEIDIQYWKRINQETYLKAGAKGSGLIGLVSDDNGQYSIGGNNYSRGIFGSDTRGNRTQNGNYNNITLSFENTEDGKIRIWTNTPEHEVNPDGDDRLVTEINNDKLYSNAFPGFTTGEVIVSITATGFNNVSTARVEIGNIDGRKNAELNTFGSYSDEKAPDIKVKNEQDNVIVASAATKVPEAYALDASGIRGDVDYTVWYNYYDQASKKALNVTDGKFTATNLGTYTVEYRAEDVYGNKSTKLFDLIAEKTASEGISFNVEEIGSAEIGSSVDLSNYTIASVCKKPSVKITVTTPGGKSADITSTASAYNLEEVGTYKVTYSYSDTYYEGSYDAFFSSVASDKPVFEKRSIPAPEYYIAGATYSAETVNAYLYKGSSKAAASVQAYACYDGGAYESIDATEFTVKKGASTVKLKFVADNNQNVFIESDEIKIVDVNYGTSKLDVTKYFVGDFGGSSKEDYTVFTSDKSGTASLKFINPLLLSRFSVSLNVAADEQLEGVDLILTDYYDRSNQAVISLNGGDAEAKEVSVNGSYSALPATWKGKTYDVSYRNGFVYFDTMAAPADFGFTSDKCLFEISFRSVSKGFKFNLSSICNQSFGKQYGDEVRPLISANLPEIVVPVNSEYVTDIPLFIDVLSPSPAKKCSVTVNFTEFNDSSVKYFSDVTGKQMNRVSASVNYKIKFTEYGCYTLTYSYTDGSGRTGNLQQLVYVYDLVAPSIRFKKQPSGVVGVRVGETVTPLEVVIEDNLTALEDITVWTVVYDERGRFICASTEGSFVLTEKGRYTVYIHCKDQSGNTAGVSYDVYAG